MDLARIYEVKILKTDEEKERFDKVCSDIYFQKEGWRISYKLKKQAYFAVVKKTTNEIVAGCKLALSWEDNEFLCDILDKNYKGNLKMHSYTGAKDKYIEINRLFSSVTTDPFYLLKYKLYEYFMQSDINYAFVLTKESVLRMINQSGLGLVQRLTDKDNPIRFNNTGAESGYFLCKLIPNYRIMEWSKQFDEKK